MTPKLSNLDIPEIKSAAAEWALVSSQIEKITLHRFKPAKLHSPEGPFYAIIIWVSPEVDVNIAPWMELSECRVGEEMLPKEQVREQYIAQDGKFDREQASKHPLYDLWNLFWELSVKESKERAVLYSFYRDGFERSDPRFDWLVLLLNVGEEYVFDPDEIYDDLDNTETGSAVLFSRKAEAPQEDGTTTQPPVIVESCVPQVKDCDSPPVQASADKLVTLTPVQEDKWDAREAAEKYIRGCKKESVPSIKEAVAKVKAKLKKSYQDKTIRNWIKDLFPTDSRKPGRRPKEG